MSYQVQTPVFEGPFDLLLHLILQEEVEIFEVSLSPIIDQYLTEVARLEGLDLDIATEFLLIAATLIDLKIRRLLPNETELELDEELLRFEERDLLLARLLECKTFKDAAREIAIRMQSAARSVPRQIGPEEPFRSMQPDPFDSLTTSQLQRAAIRAFTAEQPTEVSIAHLAPIRVSVAEAVDYLIGNVPEEGFVSFRELCADAADRIEIIVRFLAVLELFKQGVIEIEQAHNFGELVVSRTTTESVLDDLSLHEWDDELDLADDAEEVVEL